MTGTVRELALRSAHQALGIPEGGITVDELKQLADETQRLLDDCGPFDPASTFLTERLRAFKRLRFLLLAEQYELTQVMENSLTGLFPREYIDLFDKSIDELYSWAEHWEDMATRPTTSKLDSALYERKYNAISLFAAIMDIKRHAEA